MMAWLPWLVDGLICALLVAGLVGGVRLYRQLRLVQQGRAEMQALIDALTTASDRAQASAAQLRAAAEDSESRLQTASRKARILTDELGIMTETADALAGRLEQAASAAGKERPARRAEDRAHVAEEDNAAPLLKALRGMR